MEQGTALDPTETLRRLSENLSAVTAAISSACGRAGRPPGSAALLPVVKSVGPEVVKSLHALGIRDVAEGTVQGAHAKRAALSGVPGLRWHLIGHLQRNKVRRMVEGFASLHSLDSLRLAEAIEEHLGGRPARGAAAGPGGESPLASIYLEVNVSGEASKGGVALAEARGLLDAIRRLPGVASRLAGLMTMAPESADPEGARPVFRALRELRDSLAADGLLPPGAGLSMGMSGDYQVAVEEGATVVRVGTRLFSGLPTGRLRSL